MVLHFTTNLQEALQHIQFSGDYRELLVQGEVRTPHNTAAAIAKYGQLKWQVVDLLNEKYSTVLKDTFDLYNWLDLNEKDEVAYFLNEAGSNCLNYSDHKIPHRFHLWRGNKGFIIGIEQQGAGFNAVEVQEKNKKVNQGAAFDFFRRCKSTIFFDDSQQARTVYMEYLFTPLP